MGKWINKMWYIQIMEHYTVIKEGNCVIFNNIDGSRQYYAKWNKLDRQRWILYDLTYMWNLKKTHVSANIIVVFALLKFVIWYWNMFSIDVMLYVILVHIYHFMFFANDLLLAYFTLIFILDYENDCRQKANLRDFPTWDQNGS